MYKTVHILLIVGLAAIVFNFLKNLVGPDLFQLGMQIPAWTISFSLLPGLIVSSVILILFQRKNAVVFWGYLVLTILTLGGIINLITTISVYSNTASTLNNPATVLTIANVVLIILMIAKLAICFMMWKLIERGELKYPENR